MNPDKVQDLVTIAFCIEAISDKKDCTTRYIDLPGKPLEDFIIAGINTGKYFRELASDILNNKNPNIFDYFVPALKACNLYKSQKNINLGLLEIMFPTVYARLISKNSSEIIDNIINLMKKENLKDVQNLIESRKESWKTSKNAGKINFIGERYQNVNSPYECYIKFMEHAPKDNAGYQWSKEYKEGLPILKTFFNNLSSSDKPLLEEIKESFKEIRSRNQEIKIGVIAYMCAAAIFLYLSYK